MTTIGYNEKKLVKNGNHESNIGNLLADSLAAVYDDTRIAFMNNGGIRSNISVGDIWYDDILYVMPFDNTVDLVTMSGSGIRSTLETAAKNISPDDVYGYPGFGFQISGLRVDIFVTEDNSGSRVHKLEVEDEDGLFVEIDNEGIYNVALTSFIAGGGFKKQKQTKGIFDDHILSHQVGS